MTDEGKERRVNIDFEPSVYPPPEAMQRTTLVYVQIQTYQHITLLV